MDSIVTTAQFIQVFREASPYINSLRGKTLVIGLSSFVIESGQLANLMQDIALLNSLGVKLVIVFGVHKLVEEKWNSTQVCNIDKEQMQGIKQFVGQVRIDIEAYLSIGYSNLSIARSEINVVGSNFISAKSKGIINGVDAQLLGQVRKIDISRLIGCLKKGDIVLVSPLGYSVSGVTYYIPMSELAADIAIELQAEKLLFITRAPGILDNAGKVLNNLTLNEAQQTLVNIKQHDDINRIFHSISKALSSNLIKRVQLISGIQDGSIVAELFSRDGMGTSLSYSSFTNIRRANISDIPMILQIVNPLVNQGFLLARNKTYFETNISQYFVFEYDEMIYGCVQFKPFVGDSAELACLAVLQSVQDEGYGELLLAKVIEEAKINHKKRLFAITTQAADWFKERDFIEVSPDQLPEERLLEYHASKRQSRVFLREL